MKNYYEILEVDKNASKEIIDKAYKTLVKKYHPDLKNDFEKLEAESKIKEINEAYDVLSDKFKREEYNQNFKNNYISIEEYNLLIEENNKLKKEIIFMKNKYTNNDYNYSQNNNANNNVNNYQNFNYNYTNNNSNKEFEFINKIFNNSKLIKKNKKNRLLFFLIIILISIIILLFGLHIIESFFINNSVNPIILIIVAVIIIISLK